MTVVMSRGYLWAWEVWSPWGVQGLLPTCCSRAHHSTQNGGFLGGAKPGGFGDMSLRSFERSQKGAEDSPCLHGEARRWEWLTDRPKPRRRKAETTLHFASPFTGGPEKVSVPVEIRLHLALNYSTLCETVAFHTAFPLRDSVYKHLCTLDGRWVLTVHHLSDTIHMAQSNPDYF